MVIPLLSWQEIQADENNIWYRYNDSQVAVVFVHGIFSDSRSCWLREASSPEKAVFWPELIDTDSRFANPSIYLGGFYTDIDAGEFGFAECADQLCRALKRNDEHGRPGPLTKQTIVFVCHSTGGVVVRYLIDRYEEQFRNKTVGLVLIA